MLEPFLRPRAGKTLHAFGVAGAAGAAFMDAGVSTPNGFIHALVFMPLVALVFAVRFVGITAGEGRGLKEMPWAYRIASWVLLALVTGLVGALSTQPGLLAFLTVCGLDAAGALTPHRPAEEGQGWRLPRVNVRRWPVAVAVYAVALLAVHFLWALHVPYGPLLDWTMLVLGFAALLRLAAPGPRAEEAAARPPPAHRVHAATARPVADPTARAFEDAARSFLTDGDAGALLTEVRRTARFAGFKTEDARDVENHVLAALARAGTTREADLAAAVDALEEAVTTQRTVTVTR